MIVQHIIWFLFNFHPKIPKFRFFSFFFRKTENFPKFFIQNQKGGLPLHGSKTILYLQSSKVLRDKKRFKLIESNVKS